MGTWSEREVLAGCSLTGTFGRGAFPAAQHSPPILTWPPRQQLPFPFVSGAAFPLVLCMVLEVLGL